MTVSLFVPCYIDQLWPSAAASMARVLRRVEVDIEYRPAQTCCGQPAFNAGHFAEARDVAEAFVHVFRGADVIVSPSGSCVAMVKRRYPALFAGHPLLEEACAIGDRMYELSQFLVDVLGVDKLGAELHRRAVFQDGCQSLRELGIHDQPRRLLRSVRGLTVAPLDHSGSCCGFGGLFATRFGALSAAMADETIQSALARKAECIISTEASCLLHLRGRIERRKLGIETMHLAEVLATREGARA